MNKSTMYITLAVTAMLALLIFTGCEQNDPSSIAGTSVPNAVETFDNGISPEELGHLLRIREEEKLARDVYDEMLNRWQLRVFNNIRTSEQSHMDAMLRILNRYSIGDPVGDNDTGVFTDPALQALYDQLIEQGSASVTGALAVGVSIEEMDIADLEAALAVTDNEDIRKVYGNLLAASRQHLLAFSGHSPNPKTPISR
jgi:hypothetical protein